MAGQQTMDGKRTMAGQHTTASQRLVSGQFQSKVSFIQSNRWMTRHCDWLIRL